MKTTDSIIPYVKNQIANNDIDLGQVVINALLVFVIMAVASGLVAFAVTFLKRKEELIDGQKKVTFSDKWAFIPLVSLLMWLTAAMWILLEFLSL